MFWSLKKTVTVVFVSWVGVLISGFALCEILKAVM